MSEEEKQLIAELTQAQNQRAQMIGQFEYALSRIDLQIETLLKRLGIEKGTPVDSTPEKEAG